ncbi:VanZ family protein [Yinghuangia soli]|uniref:VanZ family protein n=1 Tax=Yinghuangia soli TaxID=2908204 RepID=A0AA41U660_9ACTN|nr:VanZ family protein [Yinghuangia soli]MCF2532607.1 VanZ family protein [Yinghuangia soli]
MGEVWRAWGDVLTVWAVGVPLLVAATAVLVRVRVRQGRPRREALRWSVAEAAIVGGTLPWVWMILTPTAGPGGVSLVPLRDLVATLGSAPSTVVVQVGANLVLFVPLGFCLPLRLPRWAGVARMTLLGAAVSASLESAQYVLGLGRVSSVDDVLMNAAGAGLGACAARLHVARREAGRAYSSRLLLRLGGSGGLG